MSVQLNAEECNIRRRVCEPRLRTVSAFGSKLARERAHTYTHACILSLRDPCACPGCTTARAVAASALSAIIVPASHFDVDALTLHAPPPLAAAPRWRNRRPQSRPLSILPHPLSFFHFPSLSLSPSLSFSLMGYRSGPRQRNDAFMRMCVPEIYEATASAVCTVPPRGAFVSLSFSAF